MPCTYEEGPVERATREADEREREWEKVKAQAAVDKLTRILCTMFGMVRPNRRSNGQYVFRVLEPDGGAARTICLDTETCDWWDKHKEQDRLRKEREAAEKNRAQSAREIRRQKLLDVKAALEALTAEQRAVLNLGMRHDRVCRLLEEGDL